MPAARATWPWAATDDWVARLHQFRAVTAEEEMAWAEAFSKAMGL